uniref:Immunoglobulin V-set domain-containing protein n=1 Tax=Salarias fasciatus TaxID=181472 RepID=A0A672H6I9_SALFA
MRPLFISVLLAAMSLGCRAQKDNVLQPRGEVTADEGHSVTLDCLYNTTSSNEYLFWYKQEGNKSPKFILTCGAVSTWALPDLHSPEKTPDFVSIHLDAVLLCSSILSPVRTEPRNTLKHKELSSKEFIAHFLMLSRWRSPRDDPEGGQKHRLKAKQEKIRTRNRMRTDRRSRQSRRRCGTDTRGKEVQIH